MQKAWKRNCLYVLTALMTLIIVSDAEAQIFRRRRAMNRGYWSGPSRGYNYNYAPRYSAGYGTRGTYTTPGVVTGGAAVTAPGVGVDAGPAGASVVAPGVGVDAGFGGAGISAPGVGAGIGGGAVAPPGGVGVGVGRGGAAVDAPGVGIRAGAGAPGGGLGAGANINAPGTDVGVGGAANLQGRGQAGPGGARANLDAGPADIRVRGQSPDAPGQPQLAPRQDVDRDAPLPPPGPGGNNPPPAP